MGDDGVQVFACRRDYGSDGRPLCDCGMRSTKRCTFELGGSKAGQVCGARLCPRCAHPQGQGNAPGVCKAHAPKAEAWDPTRVPKRRS